MAFCGSSQIASTVVVFPLYCDCCGKEKLAEIRGSKLVIYDTRHGQRHFVSITLDQLHLLTDML